MPRERDKDDETVLQRTEKGYVETSVDEIPLSDATGEGRVDGRARKRR